MTAATYSFRPASIGDERLVVALNLGRGTALPAPGMRSILVGRDASLNGNAREPKVSLGEAGFAILSPRAL